MTASPTPPDFFAESAKNPDHIVDANKMVPAGIPSEGEIQRLLFEFATCTDLAAGPSALDANARSFARAILDLIRPAFEAKEREIEAAISVAEMNATAGAFWAERGKNAEARALSAEAKLAQAVEDEREKAHASSREAMLMVVDELANRGVSEDLICEAVEAAADRSDALVEVVRRNRARSAAAKGEKT